MSRPTSPPAPSTDAAGARGLRRSMWAIAGSGLKIIATAFVLLLAGIPIPVGLRWWQQRDAGPAVAGRLVPSSEVNGAGRPAERVAVMAGNGTGERGHDA